jgi:membrane protein
LFIGLTLAIAILYRFGPSLTHPQFRWISPGSVLSAILWIIASGLFSWYASNFANYDKTYGSLGAVAALLTWLWLSALIVLVGAEFNAELDSFDAEQPPHDAQ